MRLAGFGVGNLRQQHLVRSPAVPRAAAPDSAPRVRRVHDEHLLGVAADQLGELSMMPRPMSTSYGSAPFTVIVVVRHA